MNNREKEAIDKALSDFRERFQYGDLIAKASYSFDEFVYDDEFKALITGDAMFRLDQILHASIFNARGRTPYSIEVKGLEFSDIRFYEHQSTGYHVLSTIIKDTGGNPLVKISWNTKQEDQINSTSVNMTLSVLNRNKEFEVLLKSNLIRKEKNNTPHATGDISFINFNRFINIMDIFRDKFQTSLLKTHSSLNKKQKEKYIPLIECDNYLPGKLSLYAHNKIIGNAAIGVHKRILKTLPKLIYRYNKREINQNSSFLLSGNKYRPIYSTLLQSENGSKAILTYDANFSGTHKAGIVGINDQGNPYIVNMTENEISKTVSEFLNDNELSSLTSTFDVKNNNLFLTKVFLYNGGMEIGSYCLQQIRTGLDGLKTKRSFSRVIKDQELIPNVLKLDSCANISFNM